MKLFAKKKENSISLNWLYLYSSFKRMAQALDNPKRVLCNLTKKPNLYTVKRKDKILV